EEVVNRLTEWDHLCGRVGTRLKTKVVIGRNLYAPEAAARVEERTAFHPHPYLWAMLDAVPGPQWFSVMQAGGVLHGPRKWAHLMRGRIVQTPQYYISPEQQADLRDFQQKIRLRQAGPVVEELAAQVRQRSTDLLDRFAKEITTESINLKDPPPI